eukprot:CAMPEP_0201884720 /NCGR_PEP_ID=MMETSP0902-20130614/17514_1 /ASSEMBLY_ACC=CAM_ASM_000551 /TAXON_ID=420261 /ORGANISM="Thalassiosira antarctica, Strain CCMP982" /LENGTH=481 /DNA_ID=CAMNT_0048413727 /DNA_START=245 /DNA_END=1690 /DNA_ORIENTATION=+
MAEDVWEEADYCPIICDRLGGICVLLNKEEGVQRLLINDTDKADNMTLINCDLSEEDEYQCICSEGYSGPSCEDEATEEENLDVAHHNTSKQSCSLECKNGSECISEGSGDSDFYYEHCKCTPPYWGKYCEQSITCELDCLNGGYCANSPGIEGGQWCTCPEYEGRHCQFKTPTKEDCDAALTCENGGSCCSAHVDAFLFGKDDPYFIPQVKYYCSCPIGFDGERCEQIVENTCDQDCLNGGHCEIEYTMGLDETTGPQWCSVTRPGGCTGVDCMYPTRWYEKRCDCPEQESQGQFCEELNTCGCKNDGYCMDREQSHAGICKVQCMFDKEGEDRDQCVDKCNVVTNINDDDMYGNDFIESPCSCGYLSFGDKCQHAVTTVCPQNDKAKEIHESCMNGVSCGFDTLQTYFGERYCSNGGGCDPNTDGAFQCNCRTEFEGVHCELRVDVTEPESNAKSGNVAIVYWIVSVILLAMLSLAMFS